MVLLATRSLNPDCHQIVMVESRTQVGLNQDTQLLMMNAVEHLDNRQFVLVVDQDSRLVVGKDTLLVAGPNMQQLDLIG